MNTNLHKECLTKELLFHRYLYYVSDKPVISDTHYDILEKDASKAGIPYFVDKTGMVGYDSKNPYHEEIMNFLSDYREPDLVFKIQAYCWKDMWPEQWGFLKTRVKEGVLSDKT